jgi:hypothetical protein
VTSGYLWSMVLDHTCGFAKALMKILYSRSLSPNYQFEVDAVKPYAELALSPHTCRRAKASRPDRKVTFSRAAAPYERAAVATATHRGSGTRMRQRPEGDQVADVPWTFAVELSVATAAPTTCFGSELPDRHTCAVLSGAGASTAVIGRGPPLPQNLHRERGLSITRLSKVRAAREA